MTVHQGLYQTPSSFVNFLTKGESYGILVEGMAKAWRLRETEYFSEEELAEMLGGAFPALEKFLPDPAVIISTPSSQLRLYKREDIARFSIDLLNLLRRERFFTFKELSQELQVSVPAILRWKNGSRSPRRRNIQKILAFVSSILNHGHN